jgi:hypothetical protein
VVEDPATEPFIGPLPRPEGFVSAPIESDDCIIGLWQKVPHANFQPRKRTGTEYCAIRHKGNTIGCFHSTNDTCVRILKAEVRVTPLAQIVKNRLTVEQIQELPKFKDYQPGEPSEVWLLISFIAKESP